MRSKLMNLEALECSESLNDNPSQDNYQELSIRLIVTSSMQLLSYPEAVGKLSAQREI